LSQRKMRRIVSLCEIYGLKGAKGGFQAAG
jgi:hypothetical protein